MKKVVFLIPLLMLASCGENHDIRILCPKGAPSLAFYNFVENNNFQTNDQPSNIISFLRNDSLYDMVIIDTISGIKSIVKDNSFQLASTITFGNYYIAKAKSTTSDSFNEGSKITLFGKNQTPDLLFKYLYGTNYVINYVDSVTDAKQLLQNPSKDTEYVFIAEPALFGAKKTNQEVKAVENIQDKYLQKTGKSLIQASIFVKTNSDKTTMNKLLNEIENDIKAGLENPALVKSQIDKLPSYEQLNKFGVNSASAFNVLQSNSIGLGYKKSYEIKEEIDAFIKLFGLGETDEKNYWK